MKARSRSVSGAAVHLSQRLGWGGVECGGARKGGVGWGVEGVEAQLKL